MQYKLTGFFLVLLVSIFSTFFVYFFFGFFFSEYEGLNTAFISGSLTPEMPFRSMYFSGNLVISFFYSFFYEHFKGIQWITWFEYLWLLISSTLSLYLLYCHLPKQFSSAAKVALLVIVFFTVFADHHVHLIYTRVAYMVCGTSLIAIVFLFPNKAAMKQKWLLFFSLNLFFVIGTLIRNEAAIACFLLIISFAFLCLKNIKQVFILFLFPLLMVGSQSIYLALDIKNANSEEFYKQVEPDIEEQFIARGNLKPLAMMKTYRDSVMYGLANEMTFSDPTVLTPEFLRSLILPEGILFADAHQWIRVVGEFESILLQYWYLVLIVLLLSMAIFIQQDFKSNRHSFYYWLLFVASFWLLTIAQSYVDKVNERSWLPYIGLFILCHILFLAKDLNKKLHPKLYLIFLCCFILSLFQVYYLKKDSNKLEAELTFHQKQFEKIEELAKGKVLVFNSSSCNSLFLSITPFQLFDFSVFKKLYFIDSYIIPFLPYYKRYLEKECNCSVYAYPSFWKFLEMQKKEVVIISSFSRMTAIKKYLTAIHTFNLSLEIIHKPETPDTEWHAWKMKDI